MLLPAYDTDVISPGALAISDGEIVDRGPDEEILSQYEDWPREDLDRDLVIPGLVNTHTHMPMAMLRGWAEDRPLMEWLNHTREFRDRFYDEELRELSVKISLIEQIRSGTTTFADMSFFQEKHLPYVSESGIRAVLFESLMDWHDPERREPLLEHLEKVPGDLVTAGAALHATYTCGPDLMDWFRDRVVVDYEVPYAIHLSESEKELEDVRDQYGLRPPALLDRHGLLTERLLAVHGVWLNQLERDLLRQSGSKLAHIPESNMKLGSGTAPVTRAIQEGMTVSLGTDSQASNNDQDMFTEMRTAAFLQKVDRRDPSVLPAGEVVKMATVGGRRALSLEDKIGRLDPGWQADLIVIDFTQVQLRPIYDLLAMILFTLNGRDVHSTMVNGRWLMKDRELLTMDESKIFQRIDEKNYQINRLRSSGGAINDD